MDSFLTLVSQLHLVLAMLIGLLAGTVKGVTGFAMPMILISGLSSFLPPEMALSALILPTLVANVWQSLRQGVAAAFGSVRRYRGFLIAGLIALLISAQLVRVLPVSWLFLLIGGPITIFAILQLRGWAPRFAPNAAIELAIGTFAGFIGGLSGVWGPPTVAYLTALNTSKAESMRVQGVIYGLGSVALFAAHLRSGVLRAETLPLSVIMIVPAVAGMWVGLRIQDRFDQATFRKVTLAVLLVAGANLIRRGVFA